VTHPNKKELIAGSRGLLHYLELALRFQRQQRTALTHSVHDRAAGASTLGTTTTWGGPSLDHIDISFPFSFNSDHSGIQ